MVLSTSVQLHAATSSVDKDNELPTQSLSFPPQATRGDTTAHGPNVGYVPLLLYISFLVIYLVPHLLFVTMAIVEIMARCILCKPMPKYGCTTFMKMDCNIRHNVWGLLSGIDTSKDQPCGEAKTFSYFLLPSRRIRVSPEHLSYTEEGTSMEAEITEEITLCKALLATSHEQRRMCMKKLLEHRSSVGCDGYLLEQQWLIVRSKIEEAAGFARHLETLEKQKRDIKHLSQTQAVADLTGYRGLADWAERTLRHHQDLLEALCQVSFFGAALVYSTIFSATRGNIGLMCYAFALFNCGFVIPLITLGLLKWASYSPHDTLFASHKCWSMILNILVYLSVICVAAAICLSNVTILDLHFSKDDQGTPQDSPAEFDVEPSPAGYFALVCAIVTWVITLFAFAIHYTANGWSTLFEALTGHRTEGGPAVKSFRDYQIC